MNDEERITYTISLARGTSATAIGLIEDALMNAGVDWELEVWV